MKVTVTVQVLLGPTDAPVHVSSAMAKLPAFGPDSATLERLAADEPPLVTVNC